MPARRGHQAWSPRILTAKATDVDVLKQIAFDKTVTDSEGKHGLNWHGNRLDRQIALMPNTRTPRPWLGEGVGWDETRNLMFGRNKLAGPKCRRPVKDMVPRCWGAGSMDGGITVSGAGRCQAAAGFQLLGSSSFRVAVVAVSIYRSRCFLHVAGSRPRRVLCGT